MPKNDTQQNGNQQIGNPQNATTRPQAPAAQDAERQRRMTEARELEAKAASRASQQGEEQALHNQVADNPAGPPNNDEAPRQANNGTMRPAIGEKRASPDENETRYQSEESRRGE